ncbi:MAG: transglutaminase-like cysteine peptidase [Proteobacteria bacterium]|nr:transglutaminase-like cysteine peptidase [Pseudomonadota bacterium]
MRQVVKLVASVITLVVAVPLGADASPAAKEGGQGHGQPFMRVYGTALPPYGYVRFCQTFPAECVRAPLEDQRIDGSPARLAELDDINRSVNREIEPATDMEIYGEAERWTLPDKKGDCEDYALLKRHRLIARGWPASSLLMTVVRDEKGEGHAILTARTSKGDYVLDNKTDELKLWSATPYTYVMRQSYIDPNVWLSLDPRDLKSPMQLSGTRDGP